MEKYNSDFIVPSNKCSACSACINICPVGAISMQENNEGFLYPIVNENKCIKCGNCLKVCQIDKENKLMDKEEERIYYAARQKNRVELFNSSSGGFISLLAKKITENGGYFCSAAWSNGNLEHKIINNYNDFASMKGSKYFQSDLSNVFKNIKKLLDDNKQLAFVGTPCQVAGLKMYLKIDYENLYLIDIICHGTPSKSLFYKFLEENNLYDTAKNSKTLTMRNKKLGWHNFFIDFTDNTKTYLEKLLNTSFGKAFAYNLSLRKSCHSCPYANTKRLGDIMVGDYWGIGRLDSKYEDELGWNLISLNRKGEKLFNEMIDELELIQTSEEMSLQPNLISSTPEHPNRDKFFEQIKTNTLSDTVNNLLNKKNNVGILNFYWENNNYGAILTAYALNKYLNNLGYNAYNIQYLPTFSTCSTPTSDFEEFRQKYIPQTHKCSTDEDFNLLNTYFGNYIVGSDQVFRWNFVGAENDIYYLKFADDDSKKIAYSASFGVKHFEGDMEIKEHVKNLLFRFSALGIREKSGVELCKNTFNLYAKHVLDPVFLLNTSEWNKILGKKTTTYDCVHYIINRELNESLQGKLESSCNIRWKIKVQDWINIVKNAKFIVTDSFHCVCFCIIFKKQFACVVHKNSPYERIVSLYEMLGLSFNNFYIGEENFNLANSQQYKIDYTNTQSRLNNEIIKSKEFLNNSLSKKETYEKNISSEIIYLRNEVSELKNKLEYQSNLLSKYLSRPSFIQLIFSLKNENKHKIVRILGIKIKFKKK